MNIKTAGQVIRDSVTMDTVLSLYGYRVKHGFMCCPFHGEKEPSLKVYQKTGGWHCFGCGRGGSVIDLYYNKIIMINYVFSLIFHFNS